MGDHKEVIHERLFVKVPGTDKLRKTAAARLKQLLATGWRETERWRRPDHVEVRLERTGQIPLKTRLPRPVPASERPERRGRRMGGPGGPGRGPRGRR